MSSQEFVTQAELATLLGKSKVWIHKLVTKGIIRLNDDGRIDLAEAVERMKAAGDPGQHLAAQSEQDTALMREIRTAVIGETQPDATGQDAAPAQTTPADLTSYQRARSEREKYSALNERLKYHEAAGDLIRRDQAMLAITNAAALFRSGLERLRDRLASTLAAETDPRRIDELLATEIDAILSDFLKTAESFAVEE